MKHRNKSTILKNRLGIFIILVVVVLLALIIFGSKSPDIEVSKNQSDNESVQLEQQDSTLVQTDIEEETELEKVIEKTLSVKGLCEDYLFAEGDSLDIEDVNVVVERISSSSVRMTVDDVKFFLAPGADKVVNDFRVEFHEGNLNYFGAEDADNSVTLRLGCKHSDEDPNEKYVRERGVSVCETVYKECRDSFGLK